MHIKKTNTFINYIIIGYNYIKILYKIMRW